MTCPRCKKNIDDRAELCPYCRTTLFQESNTRLVLIVFIIVCALVYFNTRPKEPVVHNWDCWYSESARGQVCFDK